MSKKISGLKTEPMPSVFGGDSGSVLSTGSLKATTVRIAPVEHWCEGYAAEPSFHVLAGLSIQVYPATCRETDFEEAHGCKSKYWNVATESAHEIARLCGGEPSPFNTLALCEHMLEMD